MAEWWLAYEDWIADKTPPSYRKNCFRAFRKLPKSKSWLPPQLALDWLRSYADSPQTVSRARDWKQELSANT